MTKRTVLWTIGILIVLVLAIQVLLTTHITSYNSVDWGLLSRLPLTFWAGLCILGALLFVGRKSNNQTIIVSICIFIFLFVIPMLVLENKAAWLSISYLRCDQINFILSNGHLPFNEISAWDLLNWPGFYFIFAFVASVTGIPTILFAVFFPLITLALIGVVSYSTLKIKFNKYYSCLGSLLVMAGFFSGQEYLCPQSIAYLLLIAIVLLSARLFFTKSRSVGLSASIIILFIAIVITHLLTSFVVLIAIVLIYVLKVTLLRKQKLHSFFSYIICILFLSIFFLYQTTVINKTFVQITSTLYGQLAGHENDASKLVAQGRVFGSMAYKLELFGSYGIAIILIVIALCAISIALFRLLKFKRDVDLDLFWAAWIVTAVILGLSVSYGGEALIRAIMFMLLPVSYFAVKYFRKKPKVLILLIMLIVFIHFPAIYAKENYLYVPTSELNGVSALAHYTADNSSVFHEYLAPFPYSPNDTRYFIGIQDVLGLYSIPNSDAVFYIVNSTQYVVTSSLQNNLYQYLLGTNPLDNINLADNYSKLYDNANYQIYLKFLP